MTLRSFWLLVGLFASIHTFAGDSPDSKFFQPIGEEIAAEELTPFFATEKLNYEYINIRNLALKILERFPLDEYFFIGIGRSPTPIIAFFQQLSPRGALNLPYSRDSIKDGPSPVNRQAKLDDHIVRFVGGRIPANKKIALLDYTLTGKSFYLAQQEIPISLKKMDGFSKVNQHILSVAMTTEKNADYFKKYFNVITMPESIDMFIEQSYDSWGEYDRFEIGNPDSQSRSIKTRESYKIFREILGKKMRADPTLNGCSSILHTNQNIHP